MTGPMIDNSSKRRVSLLTAWAGLSALMLAAVPLYALLVLQPLAAENEAMRVRAAELALLSRRLAKLDQSLASLRREADEETPSYRGLLRELRGWRVEAHTYISRIAADSGLEVTAMEWTEAEPATPEFETGDLRRWLRTGVFIKLAGAWRGHRDFADNLSRCDCLVQILEEKVTASARAGLVEASMSLLVYHLGEGADV